MEEAKLLETTTVIQPRAGGFQDKPNFPSGALRTIGTRPAAWRARALTSAAEMCDGTTRSASWSDSADFARGRAACAGVREC